MVQFLGGADLLIRLATTAIFAGPRIATSSALSPTCWPADICSVLFHWRGRRSTIPNANGCAKPFLIPRSCTGPELFLGGANHPHRAGLQQLPSFQGQGPIGASCTSPTGPMLHVPGLFLGGANHPNNFHPFKAKARLEQAARPRRGRCCTFPSYSWAGPTILTEQDCNNFHPFKAKAQLEQAALP